MNHAYVDGSFAPPEQLIASGGAYGVVLLRPGEGAVALSGALDTPDCNVTEMRAVLAAVEYAPREQPLTVHTDNTTVLAALGRGGPFADEARLVTQAALSRGITLRLVRTERQHRHMQRAHQLANAARRGEALSLLGPHAEADLRLPLWQPHLTVSVRRVGERSSVQLPPSLPTSQTPRSLEVLLLALSLARPHETLLIVGASKLAAALWQQPRRALDPQLQERLHRERHELKAQQVKVLFERLQ